MERLRLPNVEEVRGVVEKTSGACVSVVFLGLYFGKLPIMIAGAAGWGLSTAVDKVVRFKMGCRPGDNKNNGDRGPTGATDIGSSSTEALTEK
jgi:hypothetical protein